MAFVVSTERGRPRRAAAASPSRSVLLFAISGRLALFWLLAETMRRKQLCPDERQHRAVTFSRRHHHGASALHADSTQRLLRRRDIGHDHEPRAAALGQACERHAGIALAELIFREEYKVGTVATGGHGDRTISFVARLTVDHLGQMRGLLGR